MIGVQSSLYSIALAVGVFSVAILSSRRERDVVGRHRWLGAYLGLVTLGLGLEWAIAHPQLHEVIYLSLGFRMVISLLIAPLLWLAVRETLEAKRPHWRELNRQHLLPIGFGVVCAVPLLFAPSLGMALEGLVGEGNVLHGRVIHTGMLGCIAVFAVQVPVYLTRCRQLLVSADSLAAPKWLPVLFVIVFTTWVLGLLRTAHCMMIGQGAGFPLLFATIEVVVAMAAFYLLVRRSALLTEEDVVPVTLPSAKYAKSELSAAVRQRISAKLEHALQVDHAYRNGELTLASLSQQVGEKPHHVSQVINRDYGIKLSGLLNELRVAAARRMLAEQPDRTVLEVALAVGFNSKSTFNATFRKATGKTPTEFRSAGQG
ncbi:MAG: hypothetical protein SynsKO_45160 [Synoicihabitans sp.]